MTPPPAAARPLLRELVAHIDDGGVIANDPRTFLGYGELHERLGLELLGPTHGLSLRRQGMDELAHWTKEHGLPAISGLIIDKGNLIPGEGYFEYFFGEEDYARWAEEIQKAVEFDWLPFLHEEAPANAEAANRSAPAVNYWLTTQWPPRENNPERLTDPGVHVQDGVQDVLAEMRPGDLVFIYESKSGQDRVEESADGQKSVVKTIAGRGGVIALARITTPATARNDVPPELFVSGDVKWWRFRADAEVLNSVGFVPRPQLAGLLGYSKDYAFRGFGDRHSGVKRLSEDEFEAIRSAFRSSGEDLAAALSREAGGQFGSGGEGPVHLALKERIAADPAGVLGEPGLRTVRVEYPFKATGDRIDVLLEDGFGRPVAVEVEVDCDGTHEAGPLQCMKYRAMLSYRTDRPIGEVRTVLAAHLVAGPVRQKCEEHQIEVVEIPRPAST